MSLTAASVKQVLNGAIAAVRFVVTTSRPVKPMQRIIRSRELISGGLDYGPVGTVFGTMPEGC